MQRVDLDAEPSNLALGEQLFCNCDHGLGAEQLRVAEERLDADLAHRHHPVRLDRVGR
jgi:hypothetical protein